MKLRFQNKESFGLSWANYFMWETNEGFQIESSILYIHERPIPIVFCLPVSVGCGMGCTICAMPQSIQPRNLTSIELSDIFEKSLNHIGNDCGFQVSFMGQGEPLLNLKNISIFCDNLFHNYGSVPIGISTVGIASEIDKMMGLEWARGVKLQLSLHAYPSSKRKLIIPAEIKFPIDKAIQSAIAFSLKYNSPSCLNIVLLKDINDSITDAQNILKVVQSGQFYVKISEFNHNPYSKFLPASKIKVHEFGEYLIRNGVTVKYFKSLGTSIGAGCGQTRLEKKYIPQLPLLT